MRYVSGSWLCLWLCVQSVAPVAGSDLRTQESTLYPFQSTIRLQDDFISGGTTSGTIGQYGWNSVAATISAITSETNRFGLIRVDTTAVSGTIGRMFLFSANGAIGAANDFSIVTASRLNTNDANTTVRIGLVSSPSANPPADGVYFEKLDADTNWFCVTRAGAVQTRNDSGIAISTAFATFEIVRSSTGVVFSIGTSKNVCTNTTNVTTAFLVPVFQIINSAAASKTMDVDYFQLSVTVSR